MDRILSNWLELGYKIDDFQFRMLGCSDKAELYAKHLDVCLPLLLQKDQHDLFAAAKLLGMTETDALEQCCTTVFGRVIASDPRNLAGDFLDSNAQLSFIARALGGKFQEILVENIDQVVLSLVEGIADEKAIQQSFGETVFFTCKSYKSIGDLDALSGCGVSLLLRAEHQVEYYQNTGQWARATDYYIMHSIHDQNLNIDNLLMSFKMNHLYQMPLLCESLCREPDYECLWRLGQWKMSKIDHIKPQKIEYRDYEKYKFNCLKAVCDNDEYTFSAAKQQMSKCIVDKLKHTSLESSKSLYPILSQMQSLIEVEDCFQLFEGTNVDKILTKWRLQDLIIRKNDFQFVEPIAAQRITLLRELSRQQPLLRTVYCEMVLNFVDYAKEECHIKVAENALIDIQKIPDLDRSIESELQLRIVQLRWLNGDKMIAHQLLRNISLSAEITPRFSSSGQTPLESFNVFSFRLKAKSLMLQGIYMAETYSDRAPILNRFESSLQIYEQMPIEDRTKEDLDNLEDNYDIFATFADREYQQIMAHIKSDLFQKKLSNIKSCKEMANALQRQKQKTDDEKKAGVINERQISIDENEIKAAFRDKQLVLQIALKHYINNLVASDKNNIKIFRVMALFIENKDNKSVIETLQQMIPKMSSYKYIPMLPQLIPHISNNPNDFFGQQINRIIEQCSTDHPHHTLPLLLALVNANKDREYTNSKKLGANDRSATAVAIIKKLRKTHLRNIVDRMLKLSEALIELAYYVPVLTSTRKNQFEIPNRYKIHGIKRFEDVLVPTCSIPPSRTNTYHTIEGS
ncbi:hypothetical protein HUJ04_005560 [Dendroctonus ponderosae]|nr:hypothetical protein HUJ04_005560 [Dendroctonus ponderosae]